MSRLSDMELPAELRSSGRARRVALASTALTVVVAIGAAAAFVAFEPSGTGSIASPSESLAAPTPTDAASFELTPAPSVEPSLTAPASFPPLGEGVVPILYLHRVVAPPAAWTSWTIDQRRRFLAYDVIPAAFAADLDWLQANGYTTILPRDLAAHWDHGVPLPPRPVIISLDDGNASWVRTVLPMLQQRGMVAEFYLTLDAIRYDEITWAEVRQLAAAGMGIGAHDVHHVQLAALGSGRPDASPDVMWAEVNGARQIIGQRIGTLPDSMAYVGGGFDATLVALVRKAGYTTARSIIRGIDQSPDHRYTLRVVAIAPHDDVVDYFSGELVPGLPTFVAKITGASQ
jgi:peptidoglycan/xylan/chitin deacetylase (PgdA/CDA1 family)